MLLAPNDLRNYLRTAEIQMKQGKMDDSIKTLDDARIKFPSSAEITAFLGIVLTENKQYKEAVAIFDQAVRDASDGQMQMLDGRFYFAYGTAAEQSGDVDKAAQLLKKSIDLDPSNAEAYNYLGYMWVDRGLKLDEGAALIRKALQLDKDNPAYIDSLGWYYFKKGDTRHAIETLKKAVSLLKPEDPTVDEHLGDAYSAANQTNRALDLWQRASTLDKENKEIAVKIAGARQKLAHQGAPSHTTP